MPALRVLPLFCAALCLAGSTVLPGQRPSISTNRETGFVLEAGTHELKMILDAAAVFLGRNLLFSPEEQSVQPQRSGNRVKPDSHPIHLQKKLILDAVSCEEVVGQLAYSRGFVILPVDRMRGIYEVIAIRGGRSNDVRNRTTFLTPEEILRRSKLMIPVQTIVRMKNLEMRTNNINSYIQQFVGSGSSLTVQVLDSRILLRGLSDRVASVIRLLQKLDVAKGPASVTPNNYAGQISYLQQQITAQNTENQKLLSRVQRLERLLGKKQLEAGAKTGAAKKNGESKSDR